MQNAYKDCPTFPEHLFAIWLINENIFGYLGNEKIPTEDTFFYLFYIVRTFYIE